MSRPFDERNFNHMSVQEIVTVAGEQSTQYPPREDKYSIIKFTETTNPELAELAWEIHDVGYKDDAGFLKKSAVIETIDKSRGPNTDYYVATNPLKPSTDQATLRKINVPEGDTYQALPAYQLCKPNLSAEGIQTLEGLHEQGAQIKEIAAMAKRESASPLAVHELIRDIIQEAQGDKDEVWFFSIVTGTFKSLTDTYGKRNFEVIGADTPIEDSQVKNGIEVRPTIVRPSEFIDNILLDYADEVAKGDAANQVALKRFTRSIMFLTEGLTPVQMSEAVLQFRTDVLSAASGALAAKAEITTEVK